MSYRRARARISMTGWIVALGAGGAAVAILVVGMAFSSRRELPPFEKVERKGDVPDVVETIPDRIAPELTEGMKAREGAAAIDAALATLVRRDTVIGNGSRIALSGFLRTGAIQLVRERDPDHPTAPSARYYYRGGELLYFESTARLPAGNGGWTTDATVIGFDGNRGALERSRSVDGKRLEVGQAMVDSVLARAERWRLVFVPVP